MKKIKWKLLINVTLSVVAFVTAGLIIGAAFFKSIKEVSANELNPATVNVEFRVGETTRTANNFVDNKFKYTDTKVYKTGELANSISNNQFYMLQNTRVENLLTQGSGINPVKNIYIGFGTNYATSMQPGVAYGDNGVLLSSLDVSAKLNGQNILINNIKKDQNLDGSNNPIALPGSNLIDFYYWYDYIDLKEIKDAITQENIAITEGLYTFNFTYNYIIKNGDIYQSVGPYNYSYSFYLIDQTTYAYNYPLFNSSAKVGSVDSNKVLQYFYNYQTTQNPILTYDASLYNLSYVKVKDGATETLTSTFETINQNTGRVTYTSNLYGTATKIITAVNGKFITNFEFTELGTYDLLIKYVVKTAGGYVAINNAEIPAYNFNAPLVNGQNPFENGTYSKSYYKLHIFGVKAYFTKNSNSLDFKHNNVVSDYTAKLNDVLADNSQTITNFGVVSGLYAKVNDNLVPKTNLPPIMFDSYGTYSYDGVVPKSKIFRYTDALTKTELNEDDQEIIVGNNVTSTAYITKNTQISNSGYYEVVIAYNYSQYSADGGNKDTTHYQVFVFRIDTSTPTVTLKTTNDLTQTLTTDPTLSNNSFTNKNVYAVWETPTYFMAPITAQVTRRNYNNTSPLNTNYNDTNLLTLGNNTYTPLSENNGNYVLKVFSSLNQNTFVEYSFVIDKNAIADITIRGIDALYASLNSPEKIGYYLTDSNQVGDLNNNLVINQPFTLTYSKKESGANIVTTYQKIPFTAFAGGNEINSTTYSNYITANHEINYNTITSSLEYVLNYNEIAQGNVAFNNAFVDSSSFIYLFTIKDAAGNESSKYVVYDLTTAQSIVTPEIDNPYNIISKATNIKWGSHKAIHVKNSNIDITNSKFKTMVEAYPNLFKKLDGNYYLISPIKTVTFVNNATNETYTFSQSAGNFATNVNILPILNPNAPVNERFFMGEKSYNYSIVDTSNITSSTSIKNDNTYRNNIWMNLDNSIAIIYGKNFNSSYSAGQATEYGEALDWNKAITNSHTLRLTYKPGEPGSDYEVKSFTYTYYEYAPNNYTNITQALNSSYLLDENEPGAEYPFKTEPTIIDRDLQISSLTIPGQTEGSELRLVSEIVNATNENGEIVTKPGYYVFKREYHYVEGGDYELDTVIRYYTFIVDRENIIHILGETEDYDIEKLGIAQYPDGPILYPDSDDLIYSTGSGIYFKFTGLSTDKTLLTAKEIQQYLNYTQILNLFNTNKLPVKFNLPNTKYNTSYVLKSANDASEHTTYISSVANKSTFKLDYKITYFANNQQILIADSINRSVNGNQLYHPSYLTYATNSKTGNPQLEFKSAGRYNIELYTTRSAEVSANGVHNYTKHSFEFTIVHESPTGNYYSKYEDNSEMLLTEKNRSTNKIQYVSTNKDDLKFVFADNPDEFKALIDAKNLSIKRTHTSNGTTVTTEIFKINNGTPTKSGVFSEVTDPITNLKTYTLNLNSFINESTYSDMATYTVTLNFIGNEADYTITNPQTGAISRYFKRDFEIVIDRIKPQYNYEQLLTLDRTKYNAETVAGLDMKNYFFAINEDFTFIRNQAYGSELDSYELFIRQLNFENGYPTYYYTITPDEEHYGNSTVLSNHPRFSESHSDYSIRFTYDIEGSNFVKNAGDMFNNLVSGLGYGYFEVIERDEAGNYKVYAVLYTNQQITPTIRTEHIYTGETTVTSTVISDQTPIDPISGNDLKIAEITNIDYFTKIIVSYNDTTLHLANNPNENTPKTSWASLVNKLTTALEFTKNPSAVGYNVTITFVNRFTNNFTLNYLVPGDPLKPIFENIGTTQFKITIPADTTSTRIVQFRVWKFENGAWSVNDLNRDSLGKPISKGEPNGASLQNETYTFSVGEYRFQLIDNFGRGQDISQFPYYYYGLGVNNINEIKYPYSQTLNGINYTAGPVELKYQINLYALTLYKYELNTSTNEFEKVQITNISLEPNITATTDNTTNVRTLRFTLPTHNEQIRYEINLKLERNNNQIFTYDFMLYKKLPQIVLKTTTGGYLNPASSPFTQNLQVTWSNATLDFSPRVTLHRTFINASGNIETQVISNIANGFVVSEIGKYTAVITNALNYTNVLNNINFELVSGSVVVYEVITIENGVEKLLTASPITSTVPTTDKVLYKYYALKKFNGTTANNEIQIRVNTSKALQVEQITGTLNPNSDSKMYRIFGGSDYGYERYIEIIFVNEEALNKNFSLLTASYVDYDESGEEVNSGNFELSHEIKSISSEINISWDSYNLTKSSNNVENIGNIIYADYYYNGKLVKTIYNFNATRNTLKLTNAGVYKLMFYDLAGNQQSFNGYTQLTINLVNNVIFLVDNEEPINNIIKNNSVLIKITNRPLYDVDPSITVYINGIKEESVTTISATEYIYQLTKQGYYEVVLSTVIRLDGKDEAIITKYNFVLINSNQKMIAFNVPQNYGFTIEKILHDQTEVTQNYTNRSELWLSHASSGDGEFIITLQSYVATLETYKTFTFVIKINDVFAVDNGSYSPIDSSVEFGTSSTDSIKIEYNAFIIFNEIGDSIIRVYQQKDANYDNKTVYQNDIEIKSDAQNLKQSFILSANTTYWIEVLTKDGKLVTSYKVTKTEPLNTTAIIVISITAAVIIILVITFIILRRHIKFR